MGDHMWMIAGAAVLLWFSVPLWRALSVRGWTEKEVKALGTFVAAYTAITCLAFMFLLGKQRPEHPPRSAVLAIHFFGISLLTVFLLISAYLQFKAIAEMRKNSGSIEIIDATYRRLLLVTELMPAPAALCILIAGARLAYENSANGDLNQPWLCWLAAGFGVMFFDGLVFYLPEMRRLVAELNQFAGNPITVQYFRQTIRRKGGEVVRIVHSLSLPFFVAWACAKPMNVWIPHSAIGCLYGLLSPLPFFFALAVATVLWVGLAGGLWCCGRLIIGQIRNRFMTVRCNSAPQGTSNA